MAKLYGIRPHPAFPQDLLKKTTHRQLHYPRDYLESLGPVDEDVNSLCDVVGYLAMVATAWASLLIAVLNPLWLLDSRRLNATAFFKSPNEAVFLRRIVILEGLAWAHGLAVAYSAHLRGILKNKAKLELVKPMMGEFESHRVHMLCFLQALRPSIFTRALIVVLQAIALPMYFGICCVYPPLCHAIARFVAGLAVRLYSVAIEDLAVGGRDYMPQLTRMHAPMVAQWHYGLAPTASMRDVLLCIRADDVFHATFNAVCCEAHCIHPVSAMERHLDLDSDRVHAKGHVQ